MGAELKTIPLQSKEVALDLVPELAPFFIVEFLALSVQEDVQFRIFEPERILGTGAMVVTVHPVVQVDPAVPNPHAIAPVSQLS